MHNISKRDREYLIKLIENGKSIPSSYQSKLFSEEDVDYIEATKDYKLVYKGKTPEARVIAETPAAPLQEIRSFNAKNPFDDKWSNLLIFGDNLYALKAIYEDQRGPNRLGTRQKIKLIYIDPPFATKQDFMKDREKAYRDKIIGAEFIEFLRKRLILMREILADDGSIYVHLDWKKGHYIKAIMDEVFGEHNFLGEIVWKKLTNPKTQSSFFGNVHDSIFAYQTGRIDSIYNPAYQGFSAKYIKDTYRYIEKETKRLYGSFDLTQKGQGPARKFGKLGLLEAPKGKHWIWDQNKINKALKENRIIFSSTGWPRVKKYLDEQKGKVVADIWDDINSIQAHAFEDTNYPTQKPEKLIERIIQASTNTENDIILDCFVGSGTTLAVAEKLNRRWIGVDSGKLAIYTSQKRLLNLSTQIGSAQKDNTRDYDRVEDFENHSKNSRALFMVYERARAGDLLITDEFLEALSKLISINLSGRVEENFSLVLPENKFRVKKLKVIDNELSHVAGQLAGQKIVKVGRVNFLISFISPKEKTEDPKPLKAKRFKLLNSGTYDNELILKMDWGQYRLFVAQLFDVRLSAHKIRGIEADGYIGPYSTYIWNYPDNKELEIDEGYVDNLHKALGGKGGSKFYVVAPINAMQFMQDEIKKGETTYIFLKVPLSVLLALIQKKQPGALKQPISEADVNDVINAVGYDFISQPLVKAKYRKTKKEYIIEIKEFKSSTLAYDPEEFENFETLSMVMMDVNYNEKTKIFDLDKVFWSDKIINQERSKAEIRIPVSEVKGKNIMIIYMDKYGNEYKVVKKKDKFS